jgi:hypothetical protein
MRNQFKIGLSLTIVAVLTLPSLKVQAALLVSSGETGSILCYDEQTGDFIDTFVPFDSGGLKRPIGLTYGPDINLYVSNVDVNNPANDSILRYDGETGAFIDTFVLPGSGDLKRPADLIFGPDNNLYVSSLAGQGIRRYDGKTGVFIDVVYDTDPSGGQNLNVSGMAFGPDNNLYFSTNFPSSGILRYNTNTGVVDTFVPADIAPEIPGGLAFGLDNNLYVGEFSPNGGISRYDGQTGALIDTFVPAGSGGLNTPSLGVTFGPDNNLYVSSYGNSSVLRYNGQTGAFINTFVFTGSGGLNGPESLTFSPTPVPEPYKRFKRGVRHRCGLPSAMERHRFPATGQMTCWDSSGNLIPCAGTGHDGEIQAGATLRYRDNGNGTITDLNTKLAWEKQSDDGSIHDQNTLYTWDDAFGVHVAELNAANFAGHNDWRVPNAKELQSIVNYENFNPAVSAAFNNNCSGSTVLTGSCTAVSFYWSSTTVAFTPSLAWDVNFNGVVAAIDKSFKSHVRAVRGGSP